MCLKFIKGKYMKILDLIQNILYFIIMITCAVCVHFYVLDNWNNYDFSGKIFLTFCSTIINLCVMGYILTLLFNIRYNLKIKK